MGNRKSVWVGFVVALLFAMAVPICVRIETNRRRQNPELYYGELRLVEPIVGGFTYALDGGSTTANLVDSNGVKLNIVCSPPGGLDGVSSTKIYLGTREEMWRNEARPIEQGSVEAKRIAEYVASVIPSIEAELVRQKTRNNLDEQLIANCIDEQERMARRIIDALNSKH